MVHTLNSAELQLVQNINALINDLVLPLNEIFAAQKIADDKNAWAKLYICNKPVCGVTFSHVINLIFLFSGQASRLKCHWIEKEFRQHNQNALLLSYDKIKFV